MTYVIGADSIQVVSAITMRGPNRQLHSSRGLLGGMYRSRILR